RKVPVIIGAASLAPRPAFPRRPGPVHMLAQPDNPPDPAQLLLGQGWGFVGRSSNEVQADNGAGLDKGIIGLVNHGRPRKLDDWGVLRAWAWGDSRALDYFESDKTVDAKHIGLEGHSRYGKATLVTMAYDQRLPGGTGGLAGRGGPERHRAG